MRAMFFLSTILGSLLACPLAAGQQQMKVLRLDYVVVRDEPATNGQAKKDVMDEVMYFAPDGRQRTELTDPSSGPIVELFDPGQRQSVRLFLRRKSGTARSVSSENQDHREGRPLGTKKIQDFDCKGYALSLPAGRAEHWWCTDPNSGEEFVGSLNFVKADGSAWRQDLQKATRDYVVAANAFDVPTDFQIARQP